MEFQDSDHVVSIHKKAELKYRNVNPALKYCLGCKKPELLENGRCKQKSLRVILDENYEGFAFNSIPDLTYLPQSNYLVASEVGTVDHPYGRITVFDEKGKVKTTFPSQDVGKPIFLYGITSLQNTDDVVAICTGEGVSLFSMDGRMTSQFTNSNVKHCSHVTALKNGLLATTCMTAVSGRCVTLWDIKSGKVAAQFGTKPEILEINPLKQNQRILVRNQDLRVPWFITSDSKSNIFIGDRKSQCIKVYEPMGRFIRKFDTAGIDTRSAKGSMMPQGLCCDESDNIFVADDVTNSVLLFDNHGSYVRNFPLQVDDNSNLWAIATSKIDKLVPLTTGQRNSKISPSRKLAVSLSNRNPCAQVYGLSFCGHYNVAF